jgi:hypothetical protein
MLVQHDRRVRRPSHQFATLLACLVALALPVLTATSAAAHASVTSSEPAAGAQVATPPTAIRLTFAERPAAATVIVVRDGCGRDVATSAELDGTVVTVSVDGGAPGRWDLAITALSDEDAHGSTDRIGFSVAGVSECPSQQPPEGAAAGSEAGVTLRRESSIPWLVVAIAAGAVALACAAAFGRRIARTRAA